MKKILLLFVLLTLISESTMNAQTLMDYVLSIRGDTLVIKDYADMGSKSNSLYNALLLDTTNLPAGRVYMLKANGYYPLANNITTTSKQPTVIVGVDNTRIVNNKNANSAPPLICGFTNPIGFSNTGGINWTNDLTIKNCSIVSGASDRSEGWAFFGDAAPNKRVVLENDLYEHTRWVIVESNNDAGTSLFMNDCYFVNLSGQPCRRSGGVYDGVNYPLDTIWVENTTHIMAPGSMYKFRNFDFKKAFFNHNTFINCAGSTFESLGYMSNLIVTNNIFVNSNVQPFDTTLGNWDAGETDADNLPTGLVNVRPLPASMPQLDRKILVDNNVVYWDPRLLKLDSIENSLHTNGSTAWQSQAITMNTRTQAMFDDNRTYPYLIEGKWYKELPTFTNSKNLLTSEVDSVKAFAVGTVDLNSYNNLADWRLINTDETKYFINSDWPIPIDLSYSNADLMAGGTNGFPVGDINWFPAKKVMWNAQKGAEHAAIEAAFQAGVPTGVINVSALPVGFILNQNYPNPFNPSTTITFSLPHSANASLRVFDMLGREVAILVNGYTTSGIHEVQFKATDLASGFYCYQLTSGNFTEVKKMLLLQ
jgi:hypothetical protein